MADKGVAPWTQEEVDNLNRYQEGPLHPFTCGNPEHPDARNDRGEPFSVFEKKRTLIATKDGWRCPSCDYTQDWAHDFMLQWNGHAVDSLRELGYKF